MKEAIFVFIGSGIGGMCRYFVSRSLGSWGVACGIFSKGVLRDFPISTFVVNIVGCFVIGLIYGLIDKGVAMSPEMKNFLTAGFCGGLTTFSTFAHENYLLFDGDNLPSLLLYAVLSLIVGFSFAWLGHLCVR